MTEVIVVDGSPPEIFEAHAAAWSALAGVFTRVRAAHHESVIVADDDVRRSRSVGRLENVLDSDDPTLIPRYRLK